MDGSNRTLILRRHMVGRVVIDLQVDPISRLLFRAEQVKLFPGKQIWEIIHSDLDGNNENLTVALQKRPIRIRIAGNRLFWISADDMSVSSCHKQTADGLTAEKLPDLDTSVTDFLVITPNSSTQETESDPCTTGALCSHICVPTPAGYMRCLCPHDYKLQSDGWNCGNYLHALASNANTFT